MTSRYVLEISVDSVEAAIAAERGGADRIEFCSNARAGGTTPSADLLRDVRARVRVPIFSMIRPRAGNFVYSESEFEEMKRDIGVAKDCRMDGVVLGLLDAKGFVDVERSKSLVELARPLAVTFHRAFDECADLRKSLDDVIQTGAKRLLTSGGKPTAREALGVLGELVEQAGERIIMLPGSGIHAGNIGAVVKKTRAREYHAGLSSVVGRPAEDSKAFEEAVRALAEALARDSQTQESLSRTPGTRRN
ncbi:MAG TPA: copper homeostasis protein CutC [Candidatus Methylomirabilis sp.]|nr:copper homeostasis protein CutC [Candidatus Methylomirabilis sp.]